MTAQYLEYVRQQLITATADLSGATKGQLMAWLENAQFDTGTHKRKKIKVLDEVSGKMISLDNPPIPGKQSHAKGSSIALVQPVEFCTASWRRAVLALDEHQKAWILWSYSEDTAFAHQVAITQWAWQQFSEYLGARKMARKTLNRMKALIWLAAQDVKQELAGKETYECQELAQLVGVSKSTWSETYQPHWQEMKNSFFRLDKGALYSASRSRSQQKAANFASSIAKPN